MESEEKVKPELIVFCEGLHDAWFIDEIVKGCGKISRIEDFKKFINTMRTLSRGKPVGYPNPQIFIIHSISNRDFDIVCRIIVRRIKNLMELVKQFREIDVLIVLDQNGGNETQRDKSLCWKIRLKTS